MSTPKAAVWKQCKDGPIRLYRDDGVLLGIVVKAQAAYTPPTVVWLWLGNHGKEGWVFTMREAKKRVELAL